MVHTCVVAGCRNRRTPGTALSFYRFPRDPERKQRWIAAVNREGWILRPFSFHLCCPLLKYKRT
uniref:THAP domain-containing protein 1 n=1 Tax=Pygocentrus nattereri TaxID=42514 RepID=A0AAR2JYK9_PYGNA